MARQRSGQAAENAVLAAAEKRGLKLVERNYRTRLGELDLVVTDSDSLIVIEVRYRSHTGFGNAAESVNKTKQQRIIAATKGFLANNHRWSNAPVRFDVVGVNAQGELDWIEHAFLGE